MNPTIVRHLTLKLLGMVLIKLPSKDNDFKFVKSPTFEGKFLLQTNIQQGLNE
jgi:hypothetical protein